MFMNKGFKWLLMALLVIVCILYGIPALMMVFGFCMMVYGIIFE